MFDLPERTLYNRRIPKNKFYEKLKVNTKLKEMFAKQIDYIVWKHKLSKETINLDPADGIQEIQVFEIHLKQRELAKEILENIDKAIPYPILHVLIFKEEARLAMAYKQRNKKDENRFVLNSYYESDWQPINEISTIRIINGLNLKAVYESILRTLITLEVVADEPLETIVEKQKTRERLEKVCTILESKIKKEKQFNRKVELNIELQKKLKELRELAESKKEDKEDV